MPYFVLNRNYALQGHGHSINFVKGDPCWVPVALVKEAVGIGAECLDDEPVQVLEPEKEVEPELSFEERETLMFAAFDQILARNGDPAYRDNWHDIVGYAKLVDDRMARDEQAANTPAEWPDESRIDAIGQNGGTGEHYPAGLSE